MPTDPESPMPSVMPNTCNPKFPLPNTTTYAGNYAQAKAPPRVEPQTVKNATLGCLSMPQTLIYVTFKMQPMGELK
jgi:hypothetical protein